MSQQDLTPQARAALVGLVSPPDDPPGDFGLDDLAALLDAGEPDASLVLRELVQHGLVQLCGIGRFTVSSVLKARARSNHLVLQAVHADLTLDPHAPRLAKVYTAPGEPHCADRIGALEWFLEERETLMGLLTELIERDWPELCATLAEAVFGLTGHSGHHRDRQRAAHHGIVAVNRLHLDPAPAADKAEHDAREHRHHQRMATFLARLADARTNLHDHDGALDALDQAEEHARQADDQVLAVVLGMRGRAHQAAGNLDAAETELRDALALDLAHGHRHSIVEHRRHLAAVLTGQGRHDEALDELDQAATTLSGLHDRIGQAKLLTATAAVFVNAATPQKAFGPLATALELVIDADAPACRADIYLQLARASRAGGAYAIVTDEYFRDAATFYQLGHREDLAEVVDAERVGQD
ncbi:hypothetical protein SAMN04488074_13631 [Lentzea albidocapillata subsp. violacea]|uniref:Tetratricopeptide repeat-containing protein n=1 Tax=Lentzea albidocapillata subsp. violacea TaxID=128104 RepID=A0A1G9YZL6_9PSEU|nr:tetratricopeptide repeat protein [Lentzea albidocapillata]SDN14165.1 hypothetical protein SAMN04488074_13631 [Lentzea albidocapillata subsp. violacea]